MKPLNSSSGSLPYSEIPRGFIVVFILGLLVFILGGAWFYASQRDHVRREVEKDLLSIAELKTRQIVTWRSERLHDALILEELFLDPQTIQWLENPNPSSAGPILSRLGSLGNRLPYSEILLVNTGGTILLSQGDSTGSIHPDAVTAMGLAFQTRQSCLSQLHAVPDEMVVHLDVIIPLFTENGRPVGAVLLSSKADMFLFPLIQSWPTSTQTAETLLVRRDGDSVLFLNELRHRKDTALRLRIPLTQTKVPAVQAVLGKEGMWEGLDYRGVRVISVLKSIPDSSWFMVSKIDWDEAFAGWRFRSILILFLIGTFIVALAAVMGVMWQRRSRSHYETLYRLEAARRESDLRYHTILMSIGDAVIATDADSRVVLLNSVAETLTGWPLAEARGKPLSEVFHIINELTRQPAEDPVALVLREGKIVGLANHTALIARDGTERPIADAGSPIRDEQGRIIGVVLVFRDQTRERKAEMELRESESRLRLAQAAADAGIWDWDIPTDTIAWSVELYGLFGLDPETDEAGFDVWREAIHPEDRAAAEKRIQEAIEKHTSLNSEYRIVLPSGQVRWINALGNTIYDEDGTPLRMSGICIDITARKQIEEMLRENVERIQMALKVSRSFTFEWDLATDGVVRSASCGPILELAGTESEHDTAQSFFQRIHAEDRERFVAMLGELRPGAETYRTEYRLIRGDGATAVLEEVGLGFFDVRGELCRLIGVTTDITTRKQAEELARQRLKEIEDLYCNAPVGLCLLDRELRFVRINEHLAEINGIPAAAHIGKRLRDLLPVLADAVEPEMRQVLDTGQPRTNIEIIGETPAQPGVKRSWLEQWLPVRDAEGFVTGLSIVVEETTERKKAEEALRQSREDLNRAQSVGNIGSWRLDTQRNILTWSPENYRIFGIPEGTPLTYETFLAAVHPEDRTYVDTKWKAGLCGEPYDIEHRLLVNGRIKWIREKAYLEFNNTGELIGGFGISQDITARKEMELELLQARDLLEKRVEERTRELLYVVGALEKENRERMAAEESLKAERQRLYDVFDTLPAYVILLSKDYHVPFANRFFEERFGKDEGRPCYEFLFHRSEPCETCETFTVFKTGQPHHWEWTGPDGRIYDISDFPFTDADGTELVMEMGLDITEQKRAQEELHRASLYARSLIEASLDPLVTISPEGIITDVNTATELVTGAGREELIGSDFSNYFTEPQKAREGYEKVLSEGFVRDYPLTIQHRSGQRTDVLYHAALYRNEAGEVQGVFAAARDITDRKAAQAKQDITNSLLALFAQKTFRKEYLDAAVRVIHDWSGCQGVGIRLVQSDGCIPFVSSIGLDEEFLARESGISIHHDACVCIRVVAQEPDVRESPFLTPKGSFQCGNTLEFVRGLSEQEKSRYRGTCPGCGYATVIVIPIRYRETMMGVVHLSDPQVGKVSREAVEFLESMAIMIGEALHRFEIEQSLRSSESRLTEAQRIAHLGNWDWDLVGNRMWWSDEVYRIHGVRPEEFAVSFETIVETVCPEDRDPVR